MYRLVRFAIFPLACCYRVSMGNESSKLHCRRCNARNFTWMYMTISWHETIFRINGPLNEGNTGLVKINGWKFWTCKICPKLDQQQSLLLVGAEHHASERSYVQHQNTVCLGYRCDRNSKYDIDNMVLDAIAQNILLIMQQQCMLPIQ